MAHLIMSFGFDGGEQLAWSVEIRREKHGEYSPVADAFKSHTLVYLATTERDSVRLRSNVRDAGGDQRRAEDQRQPDGSQQGVLERDEAGENVKDQAGARRRSGPRS